MRSSRLLGPQGGLTNIRKGIRSHVGSRSSAQPNRSPEPQASPRRLRPVAGMSFDDVWLYGTMALAAYGLICVWGQARQLVTSAFSYSASAPSSYSASAPSSTSALAPSSSSTSALAPSGGATTTELRELLFAAMEAHSGEVRPSARTPGSGAAASSSELHVATSLWVTKTGTWHSMEHCSHLKQAKEKVKVTANDDTMAVLRLVGAACKICKKGE